MDKIKNYLMFKAFAEPARLRMACLLKQSGELCVCQLMDILKMGQSKVSRHLAYLKKAGLVQSRSQGLWSYYSLTRPKDKFHHKLLACLADCCCEASGLKKDAGSLKSCNRIQR